MSNRLSIDEVIALGKKIENWERDCWGYVGWSDTHQEYKGSLKEIELRLEVIRYPYCSFEGGGSQEEHYSVSGSLAGSQLELFSDKMEGWCLRPSYVNTDKLRCFFLFIHSKAESRRKTQEQKEAAVAYSRYNDALRRARDMLTGH